MLALNIIRFKLYITFSYIRVKVYITITNIHGSK